MRDASGKQRWTKLIAFTAKGVREAWSAQIIAAVHEAHPDALQALAGEAAP
jgi:hypothetical protein